MNNIINFFILFSFATYFCEKIVLFKNAKIIINSYRQINFLQIIKSYLSLAERTNSRKSG